jgi:PBP1b-binding outer membrane lipoprotein LpoB
MYPQSKKHFYKIFPLLILSLILTSCGTSSDTSNIIASKENIANPISDQTDTDVKKNSNANTNSTISNVIIEANNVAAQRAQAKRIQEQQTINNSVIQQEIIAKPAVTAPKPVQQVAKPTVVSVPRKVNTVTKAS